MVGYILFDEKKGVLEFSNFKASLTRSALNLGGTSKRNKSAQAGTHGEGFKVAALVMARQGYQVRYESSSFYWTFVLGGKDGKQLYCNLSPIAESRLIRLKKQSTDKTAQSRWRGLTANCWEDVSVQVGRVHGPKWGKKLEVDQVMNFLKVSIDLHPPSNIIHIPGSGNLILDPAFKGKIFLKGLLISESHSSLKFGYDFSDGRVNRDRERISNSKEEATTFGNIWREAIKQDPSILSRYVQMFEEESMKSWSDIRHAQEYVKEATAKAIWQYYLEEGEGKFYYNQNREGGGDVSCIGCLLS